MQRRRPRAQTLPYLNMTEPKNNGSLLSREDFRFFRSVMNIGAVRCNMDTITHSKPLINSD